MNTTNQSEPAQLFAKYNFTSEFFSNFINETSVERSHSNASMSEIQQFQFSVNEQKFKLFHAENLVNIWWSISKRYTLQRWIINKQYIKSLEKRTPNHLTKTLLKVFYTIAVKLQIKYSFAFRKLVKNFQENRHLSAKQLESGYNRKNIGPALQKIHFFYHKLSKKFDVETQRHFIDILKQIHNSDELNKKQMLSESILKAYNENWKANHHKDNLQNKIQIIIGTLNLTIHPLMRQAFLKIAIHKETLEQNNISHIQPKQKSQFKIINNSIEVQEMHDQLFKENQQEMVQHHLQLPLQSCSKDETVYNVGERKEELVVKQFLDKHNPKHLKFSKDTKRKNFKSATELQGNEFYQHISIHAQNNHIERSQTKSQAGLPSYIKRSALINASDYHSRSFVKKIYHPIQLNPIKLQKAIVRLEENDLPPYLNQGLKNKEFTNIKDNVQSRSLKHLELRNQFTDFNDLFFIRQMDNLYESTIKIKASKSHSRQSAKKSISLAKIKEKINKKTIEEYFQRHKKSSEKLFSDFVTERRMVSEPSIEYALGSRKSMKKSYNQRIDNEIPYQNSSSIYQTYQHLPNNIPSHLRFPSNLPQYFDYYVDKSLKKSAKNDKSLEKESSQVYEKLYTQRKRKEGHSKSKKRLFNPVKSSTNRMSIQRDNRSKKSVQNSSFLSPYLKYNVDRDNLSKSKKQLWKQQHKEEGSRKSIDKINKGQYYIGFRDPPKKKMKKNI